MIGIQKYRYPDPINRFRTYLGENYIKEENFKDAQGNIKNETLPLIAFYILGYCPQEFDCPYIIVENKIFDGVYDKQIDIYSPIIDLLTHKAIFVIATPPQTYKWRSSRQEAIIRLFRQKIKKEENNTIYELQEEPKDQLVKEISEYLNRVTQQEEIRKKLNAEDEYYKSILDLENELTKTKQREEEQRRKKEKALIKLAQRMKKYGESIEDIMRETGLSRQEIDKL